MPRQVWGYIYRKFGGKRFRIGTWHNTKSSAQAYTKELRKRGYEARITPRLDFEGKKKYVVWGRGHGIA